MIPTPSRHARYSSIMKSKNFGLKKVPGGIWGRESPSLYDESKYRARSYAILMPKTAPRVSKTLYKGEHRIFLAYLYSHWCGYRIE